MTSSARCTRWGTGWGTCISARTTGATSAPGTWTSARSSTRWPTSATPGRSPSSRSPRPLCPAASRVTWRSGGTCGPTAKTWPAMPVDTLRPSWPRAPRALLADWDCWSISKDCFGRKNSQLPQCGFRLLFVGSGTLARKSWKTCVTSFRSGLSASESVVPGCHNVGMSESSFTPARQGVHADLGALRVGVRSASRQDRCDQMLFLQSVVRRAEHELAELTAQMDSNGEFTELGVRAASAIADLLRCREVEARRIVAVARAVFPTTLGGLPLEPRLPATAMALAGWEIDQAHAEVIDQALRKDAAERIGPEQWAALEEQLAELARHYRPDELAKLAAQLLE